MPSAAVFWVSVVCDFGPRRRVEEVFVVLLVAVVVGIVFRHIDLGQVPDSRSIDLLHIDLAVFVQVVIDVVALGYSKTP